MLELDEYQNKGLLWYGCKNDNHICKVSTQYDELDKTLNGGFPAEGIIELKTPLGIGELRLLFPYLVNKQKAEKQECVFIAPPIQLNAEFLLANGLELTSTLILPVYDEKKALWATEQALSSGCCSTVVLWQTQLSIKQVRRLMLACERGGASLVLIRYTHLQKHLRKFKIKQHKNCFISIIICPRLLFSGLLTLKKFILLLSTVVLPSLLCGKALNLGMMAMELKWFAQKRT